MVLVCRTTESLLANPLTVREALSSKSGQWHRQASGSGTDEAIGSGSKDSGAKRPGFDWDSLVSLLLKCAAPRL